jgi:SAM-dependent methyltransferase
MEWFARDFDRDEYFDIYRDKEWEAGLEGPALARCLGLPMGSRVLDLPCGWGRLRPHLVAVGYEVLGGDLSVLNLRRHSAENPGPLARLDLRALPFCGDCADGVLCAYTSWGYFRSDEENHEQLREFARVLHSGGVLVLDLVSREWTAKSVALVEGLWQEIDQDGVRYRERVGWSPGRRRIITDRVCRGQRFRHDIWLPTDAEARAALDAAGFDLDQAWGGYRNEPWEALSERWIYRAIKR